MKSLVNLIVAALLSLSMAGCASSSATSASQTAATMPVSTLTALAPITGKASASSTEDGNPPQNAFDGAMDTRWCAVDETVPQWLRMDFDAPVDFKGVVIRWEHDTTGYDYIVEGSTDGTNFVTLSDQSKNAFTGGTHTVTFDKPAKGLKSFRISVSSLEAGSWASIWEVEFTR